MHRVAFRVDASLAMGSGHLRRCLSLARALNAEGVETVFVCRRHEGAAELVAADGQRIAWLAAPRGDFVPDSRDPAHAAWLGVSWRDDASDTLAALASMGPVHRLVVDHYGLDGRWHAEVGSRLGIPVAVIDDLADRPLAADLVVDHNLHEDVAATYAAVVGPGTRLLCGPRYALLSTDYGDAVPYRFRPEVRSIGIFMGGSDPDDAGSTALRACREVAGFRGGIDIVSSRASPHHATHLALAAQWEGTRVLSDLPGLRDFFAGHDLQLGAGGGAMLERCCMGAPTVAWAIADNQRAVLRRLARAGVVEHLPQEKPSEQEVGGAVARLVRESGRREQLAMRSRELVDGRGSARVAAVLALALEPSVRLRPAAAADEALLLEWANDPQVRGNAFSKASIAPQDHAAWFRARLAAPERCHIFIAHSRAGMPFGQARFELREEGWLIDYSLDAAFRGWGHAQRMLSAALQALRGHAGGARAVGLVTPGNTASARVFRALGFAEESVDHGGAICHSFSLNLGAPTP